MNVKVFTMQPPVAEHQRAAEVNALLRGDARKMNVVRFEAKVQLFVLY